MRKKTDVVGKVVGEAIVVALESSFALKIKSIPGKEGTVTSEMRTFPEPEEGAHSGCRQ